MNAIAARSRRNNYASAVIPTITGLAFKLAITSCSVIGAGIGRQPGRTGPGLQNSSAGIPIGIGRLGGARNCLRAGQTSAVGPRIIIIAFITSLTVATITNTGFGIGRRAGPAIGLAGGTAGWHAASATSHSAMKSIPGVAAIAGFGHRLI